MKKLIFILFFCKCSFMFSQNIENDIVKYAKENYDKVLELIPSSKENLYGFETRNLFTICEIGNPIRMLKIVDECKVEMTNEWRVPLLIAEKYITLLTIIENNQNYEIVDVGGNKLAGLIDNYNNEGKKISYLLRDYKMRIDYVSFEFTSFSDKNFYKIQQREQNPTICKESISLDEILKIHKL